MSDGRDLEPRHASDGVACTAGPDGGPCVRCTGFQPGNQTAIGHGEGRPPTHGAYSQKRLAPLAEELYLELRNAIAPWHPAYEIPVRSIAEIRARLVVAFEHLDEHGLLKKDGELQPLARELAGWETRMRELANDLALTVRSQAELALDRVAKVQGLVALAELEPVVVGVMGAATAALEEALAVAVDDEQREAMRRLFKGAYLRGLDEATHTVAGEHFALPAALPAGREADG